MNLSKIEGAIGSLNLIRLLYSKKKTPDRKITERVVRIVEPYEIKDGLIFMHGTLQKVRQQKLLY